VLSKFEFLADWLGGIHIAGLVTGANEFISAVSSVLKDFKDTYT
jgi:hypothetical protein